MKKKYGAIWGRRGWRAPHPLAVHSFIHSFIHWCGRWCYHRPPSSRGSVVLATLHLVAADIHLRRPMEQSTNPFINPNAMAAIFDFRPSAAGLTTNKSSMVWLFVFLRPRSIFMAVALRQRPGGGYLLKLEFRDFFVFFLPVFFSGRGSLFMGHEDEI